MCVLCLAFCVMWVRGRYFITVCLCFYLHFLCGVERLLAVRAALLNDVTWKVIMDSYEVLVEVLSPELPFLPESHEFEENQIDFVQDKLRDATYTLESMLFFYF